MIGASHGALALPALHASIPMQLRVPGHNVLATPMAIALLEAGQVSDRTMRVVNNRHYGGPARESTLVEAALTEWWTGLLERHPMRHFRWSLHVQQLEDFSGKRPEGTAWMCLTNQDNDDIPRYELGTRLAMLEAMLPGFGQTVLAVLHEATLHLPTALDPWRALSMAEWNWWSNSENDQELLEDFRDMNGYESVEQVLAESDVMTRERFFAHLPRWVVQPQQVVSRAAIGDAAQCDFSRAVVAACDDLHALITRRGYHLPPHEVGGHVGGSEPYLGCMVLIWQPGDVLGQAIDEAVHQNFESGEGTHSIDNYPLQPSPKALKSYQRRMEQMLETAVLTERLLDLIGTPL